MKRCFLGLLVLLALCWTVITVVTALVRGEGHGAVFVASLCVVGLMCVGLVPARSVSDREVAPWLLPFAIDLALGRDEEEFYRWGSFFLEEHLFGPRHRCAERAGPSAFAQYLAYASVVPFESSPLAPKALSDLAAAGGGIGSALGACVTGDPLLLLTIPAGIVVCGAARGVGQALESGCVRGSSI